MENTKTITDLFHVAGDVDHGMESTLALGKNYDARLYIQYGDKLLVGELYRNPEGGFFVNLICPRCHHNLKISTDRKAMAFEMGVGIDIEPFRCTWELGDRQGERIAFGLSMCNWTVGVAACWRPIDTSDGPVILTGIARDA